MNAQYTRGMAAGTTPADRSSGRPPTEDQMLLEMEIRLQVAARHNEIRIGNDSWWSSRPKEPNGTETSRETVITIPRAALEAQGREATAKNLGMVTEMTTHGCLTNDGPPEALRTGDPATDSNIVAYIAGAAGEQARQFALTGRYEPSQSGVPAEKREPLFMDLEMFDQMIAERYGKRLSEDDVYREAGAAEARHFDMTTSATARKAWQAITEGRPRETPEGPVQHPTARLHPLSNVDASAAIGARTVIEEGAEVQRDARIDEDTIVRSGSCVREGARIGARCEVAAFYVGQNATVGDGCKLEAHSGVGDNAWVSDAVHLGTGARVGRGAVIGERTTLGPETRIHPEASIGNRVTTGANAEIGESVVVRDGTNIRAEARVAPHARVGERATIGKQTQIGIDAGIGVIPSAEIGSDCTLGDGAYVSGSTRMRDGATLEAEARLEHGVLME
ncbi:MAG: DapH/DapD/GlmU-related protein, partial [Acidobacteria bacterium]|nr:DapH/DapD/GlmU-related protein [Acidobacteriota bacterium]